MRNWTIAEAVAVITEGTDTEAIKEIAKHYPMFFMAITQNNLTGLAQMMPEKFTVRRLVEQPVECDEDEDEEAEGAEDGAEDDGGVDLSGMSAKELMKLCDKRGIKVPHYGKPKQFYIDKLSEAADESEDDEPDEDEESAGKYDGKKAMELYKLCKERHIKAEAKKPAKYYVDKLEAADAATEPDDDEDGWGDDEPEEKQSKKTGKDKKGSKSKKEPEEDDDDEWEI